MKKYISLIAVLALLVACMIPMAFAADITMTIGSAEVDHHEGIFPALSVDGGIVTILTIRVGRPLQHMIAVRVHDVAGTPV